MNKNRGKEWRIFIEKLCKEHKISHEWYDAFVYFEADYNDYGERGTKYPYLNKVYLDGQFEIEALKTIVIILEKIQERINEKKKKK